MSESIQAVGGTTLGCTCNTTGGRATCPVHNPSVGVADAAQLHFGCPAGAHEWLPWLRLENGSYVTFCIHCKRHEQYDT